ncbi:transglutaminase-like domain-containing protein [Aestuariivivens sediminis]|uniref:transglutaminase-like domain-containing protein n=1 Tax=Aestuariivivens sediminis TaxID=2913557 RepID=UPI001F5AB408|nr:transglutaminase-like domain-containing protein [Aestuariivivens sediminis]
MIWAIRRHPFLYLSRFRLLSKDSSVDELDVYIYNSINPKEDISPFFYEINELIFKDSLPKTDLECVKTLCRWLKTHIRGGAGLSEHSELALKKMLNNKGGVCSDIVQVFNNFCVLNGISVREWGCTRAPFDKSFGGHSFNEVFITELNKWVLLDVPSCIMFYYEGTTPLSVIEFYQFLRDNRAIRFDSFCEIERANHNRVIRNFYNTIPFLVCNYSNRTYDLFLKRLRPYVPIFVVHFILYVLNKSYHYRFPIDDYRKIFLKV